MFDRLRIVPSERQIGEQLAQQLFDLVSPRGLPATLDSLHETLRQLLQRRMDEKRDDAYMAQEALDLLAANKLAPCCDRGDEMGTCGGTMNFTMDNTDDIARERRNAKRREARAAAKKKATTKRRR